VDMPYPDLLEAASSASDGLLSLERRVLCVSDELDLFSVEFRRHKLVYLSSKAQIHVYNGIDALLFRFANSDYCLQQSLNFYDYAQQQIPASFL
jgi:hypothetical protein